MKSTNKYKVGQFVRWYEAYAEGFLGRDAGFGVITEIVTHHIYNDYINYKVLRNKHGDVMCFQEGHIESQEEFKERAERNEQKTNSSVCG